MKVITGLGNPGPRYETTRHNVGFLILDFLAEDFGATWTKARGQAEVARCTWDGNEVLLAKPTNFMNLSGSSVQQLLAFYKIDPQALVVVHDDVDMEFAKVRWREGGGHGGHNGIRNISQLLGRSDYCRCKVGVGRPEYGDVTSWVLGSFSDAELLSLESEIYPQVKERLFQFVQG